MIDRVMQEQSGCFRHAVELLQERRGELPSPGRDRKVSTVRRLPSPVDAKATAEQTLRQVVAHYHETLLRSPEALGYLESRGLTPAVEQAGEALPDGLHQRTLGYRLPMRNRQAGAAIRERFLVSWPLPFRRTGVLSKSVAKLNCRRLQLLLFAAGSLRDRQILRKSP